MGIEDMHAVPFVQPFTTGGLVLEMVYDCGTTDSQLDSLRVLANATAQRRSDGTPVQMDWIGTQVIDLTSCTTLGQRSVDFDVDITWTQGGFEVEDILDIEVTVDAEAGEWPSSGSIQSVTAKHAVLMLLEPELEEVQALERGSESVPQDQMAPGPALPLLGVALLALARRF